MYKLIICILLTFLPAQSTASGVNPIVFPNAEILNEYTTRIPFKKIDQLLVVEATLYGKTGNFIIDTGSERLILNNKHFKPKYSFHHKAKTTYGVNDAIENTIPSYLKTFEIKDIIINNTSVDFIDLSHIEHTKKMNLLGIIGYDVLKDFEIFIDLYLNQITLSRIDKRGNRLDQQNYLEIITDSINFDLIKHTIVLNTYLSGKKLKMGLDTGAEFNLINRKIHKSLLKNFVPDKNIKMKGASGKTIKVLSGRLFRIKLKHNLFFGPMRTMLTNLRYMQEAFGTRLDGVLGYEFFKQKRTIINYKKRTLYFINRPLLKQ